MDLPARTSTGYGMESPVMSVQMEHLHMLPGCTLGFPVCTFCCPGGTLRYPGDMFSYPRCTLSCLECAPLTLGCMHTWAWPGTAAAPAAPPAPHVSPHKYFAVHTVKFREALA